MLGVFIVILDVVVVVLYTAVVMGDEAAVFVVGAAEFDVSFRAPLLTSKLANLHSKLIFIYRLRSWQ